MSYQSSLDITRMITAIAKAVSVPSAVITTNVVIPFARHTDPEQRASCYGACWPVASSPHAGDRPFLSGN